MIDTFLGAAADLGPWTLGLLAVAAFAAGWVDAVVGGGLIQLPASLLVPGMIPVQAVLVLVCGSAGSRSSAGSEPRGIGLYCFRPVISEGGHAA